MNTFKTSLIKHSAVPTLTLFLSNFRRSATVMIAVVTVGVALAWPFATGKSSTATPAVTVVMTGLDNPRGLAFGDNDNLYVAEAGRGGSGPCRILRGFVRCAGHTGAVTRLHHGVQQRIVTGLPSYALISGDEAIGPHDVSLPGDERIYITIGLAGDPSVRTTFDSDFGWLVRARAHGGPTARVADVAGFEFANDPDHGGPDSNPYALLAGGGGRIVTDAGGNSLLRVSANGNIAVIATFPSRAQGRGTDAVPTSVARGFDGAYYVGELTGFPFTVGAARVYRVVPGQAPTIFRSGFTAIIDLAFGPDGSLYVLQHATGPFLSGPGALIRVAPDGTRTTIASAGLFHPTAVLIADADEDNDDNNDGDHNNENNDEGKRIAFYISNCGTCAGVGEVIRIEP